MHTCIHTYMCGCAAVAPPVTNERRRAYDSPVTLYGVFSLFFFCFSFFFWGYMYGRLVCIMAFEAFGTSSAACPLFASSLFSSVQFGSSHCVFPFSGFLFPFPESPCRTYLPTLPLRLDSIRLSSSSFLSCMHAKPPARSSKHNLGGGCCCLARFFAFVQNGFLHILWRWETSSSPRFEMCLFGHT
ncbi:hypothetical protein BDV95DRAFT_338167 [Massariosphaeria phaeospora]|uniref:Uncharacterized protein n=1 Tax=Massariosphaeria phaeospora TaxID=100035 RepID=A0A7C8IBZ2_9PLEO|nr:hypothetical protein BDV95DRAFT_338167 [Massariosphaeria phaeospora]